jgi:hypothetical protein
MIWQDIVISLMNVVFSYALVKQVLQGFKDKQGYINLQTASFTFAGMFIISFCLLTLGLIFSFAVGIFNASMWLILLLQKVKYGEADYDKEVIENGKEN